MFQPVIPMEIQRNLLRRTITALAMVLLTTSLLPAQTEWRLDLCSRFIWRGFDLNPQNQPTVQPSITQRIADSGLFINLWSSFSFVDRTVNEIDFMLFYDFMLSENYTVILGFSHYGYYFNRPFRFRPHTSQEVYISLALPALLLNPSATVYYDFNQGSGLYAEFRGEIPIYSSPTISALLTASLGYNNKQWIPDSGWSDLSLEASTPLSLNGLTIIPRIAYTFVFLDSVNPDNELAVCVAIIF